MAKQKLSFFISSMSDGGAQRVVSILCKELVKREYEVEIVSFLKLEPKYVLPKTVQIRYAVGSNAIKKAIWVRNYFRLSGTTVISFLAPFNIIALLATRGLKNKIVVADRNDPNKVPTSSIVRAIRDFLYKFADEIVVQTVSNQTYFEQHSKRKPTVIYNPIDMDDMVGKAIECKKENLIISVGRLEKQKNQESLINVFARIHDRYPDYKLIIYGEGSCRPELEKLIEEKELSNIVSLPGSVPDVNIKMLRAKLFILSSRYEGMPNALIEAMCLGLPVISTKVSGATDLIIHGSNGLLIDVEDDSQLYEAINEMLSNEDLRNHLALKAKDLADELSVNQIVNEWIEVFDKVRSN